MTSHMHKMMQKYKQLNKQYFIDNIKAAIDEDWQKYSQLEGIRKWMDEHPDKVESLRKHRAALLRKNLKKEMKGEIDGK